MAPTLAALILSSASAVLQLFSVAGVGVLAARFPVDSPLLPPSALKSLSQVSAKYLIPCLIIHTVGSAASLQVFRNSGLLILWGAVAMAAGPLFMAAWGKVAVPTHQRDSSIWKVASVASAFPNIVAMPLVIVKTLCRTSEVNADYESADACFEEGGAYIFIGSAVWSVVFFTVGVSRLRVISAAADGTADGAPYSEEETERDFVSAGVELQEVTRLKSLATGGSGGGRGGGGDSRSDGDSPARSLPSSLSSSSPPASAALAARRKVGAWCRCVGRFAAEPLNVALVLGIAVGLVQPAQHALFAETSRSPFRVIGSSIELLGSPVIGLVVLSTGAALANVDLAKLKRLGDKNHHSHGGGGGGGGGGGDDDDRDKGRSTTAEKKERKGGEGDGKSNNDDDGDEEKGPQSSTTTSATSDSDSSSSSSKVWAAAKATGPIIVGFCASRLLVAPAVVVTFFFLSGPGLRPDSQLAQLITIVSAGMPSAQILVMLLNKLHLMESATQLVFLFVFQYTLSLITTAVVVVVALRLVYV